MMINRYNYDNKTVNPFVGGSSPPRGAIFKNVFKRQNSLKRSKTPKNTLQLKPFV